MKLTKHEIPNWRRYAAQALTGILAYQGDQAQTNSHAARRKMTVSAAHLADQMIELERDRFATPASRGNNGR